MAFKAKKLKKGFFEVHGIEEFIEARLRELQAALGLGGAKAAPKAPAPTPAAKKVKAAAPAPAAKKAAEPVTSLKLILDALAQHPKKADVVKAGKAKDQLLRSLIPLYLVRHANVEVTSGATSNFWKANGVKYAAPNAAKALREHVGYAKATKNGRVITPNGVKYVEAALAGKPIKRAA
jgi:hypothetical protein